MADRNCDGLFKAASRWGRKGAAMTKAPQTGSAFEKGNAATHANDALGQKHPPLDDVAWHDFSRYEYLSRPVYQVQPAPGDPFAGVPAAAVAQMADASVPTGELT